MTKILLVEDDATMISLLTTLLDIEGYKVIRMPEDKPEQIMDLLLREKPSLVLLDVNLKGMNGFDLLRQIRQSPELPHIRVIMSSGMDYRDQCLERGADGFIMKPYMPDDLIRMMRQALVGV